MNAGDLVVWKKNTLPGDDHSTIGLVLGFRDFKGMHGHRFLRVMVMWSPSGQVNACDLQSIELLKTKTNGV